MLKLLNKVRTNYPEAIILELREVYTPSKGWIAVKYEPGPYVAPEEFERAMKLRMINLGATHVNFKIEDEFGTVRYPDYSVRELSN